jgi:drug/metabolite transporter (DMT)-like permease
MQVIVIFFATAGAFVVTGAGVGLSEVSGVGEGVAAGAGASCVSFTAIVGLLKVKPFAERYNQPFFSLTTVVAICVCPSSL